VTLTELRREAAGEPRGSLVLLHGRGVDEHDLFPLADLFDPKQRLLVVAPGGPYSFPPMGGKAWYGPIPQPGHPDPETFRESYAALTELVDALPRPLVLAGFSQGGVMAYALGTDATREPPAAIIALSTFFPTVPGLDVRDPLQRLPVAIGHGTRDQMIGVEHGRAARDRLTALGADVTYNEAEIAHTIDPRFLATLPDWIERAAP
jgi:phospholipase/carboxylesterase